MLSHRIVCILTAVGFSLYTRGMQHEGGAPKHWKITNWCLNYAQQILQTDSRYGSLGMISIYLDESQNIQLLRWQFSMIRATVAQSGYYTNYHLKRHNLKENGGKPKQRSAIMVQTRLFFCLSYSQLVKTPILDGIFSISTSPLL